MVSLSSIKDEVDEISTTRDKLEKVEVSGLALGADDVIDDKLAVLHAAVYNIILKANYTLELNILLKHLR